MAVPHHCALGHRMVPTLSSTTPRPDAGRSSRRRSIRRIVGVLLGLTISATTLAISPHPAEAARFSFTLRVNAGGVPGNIGVDAIYAGLGGGQYDIVPCDLDSNVEQLSWNSDGTISGTASVPQTVQGQPLTQLRLEFYPLEPGQVCGQYTPWNPRTGGIHLEHEVSGTSSPFIDFGEVTLPNAGATGVFAVTGEIVASTSIDDDRVLVDAFQIPTGFPDPPAPLQTNGNADWGTFGSGANIASAWTAGLGWAGRYTLFITDTATSRRAQVLTDIRPGAVPTIDLDAACFGFEICTFDGSNPDPPGRFTPVAPVRILDTRNRQGITNGPEFCTEIDGVLRCGITTGGGAETSLDPLTRRAVAANHTLQVTGVGGVPTTGVSAVLLNVTAVDAPGPGFVSVIPPGSRGSYGSLDLFDDQGWFGRQGEPATSNLNVNGPAAVPNLVMARVGAGGTISFYNSFGPTEVIADLAGWFATSGPTASSGSGFSGLSRPSRVFDTRTGIGTDSRPIVFGEPRSVDIAGAADLPDDARAVVVNLTITQASAPGFLSAYPSSGAAPRVSNLNFVTGDTRANLAVVALRDGRIDLAVGDAPGVSTEAIVDVMGYFSPGGAQVIAVNPVRIVDSRNGIGTPRAPFGPSQTRTIAVANRSGIPRDATAVIANITGTGATSPFTYLTTWPTGPKPPTSNVNINITTGSTVPNLVMVELSADGTFEIANEFGEIDVLVDVMGYMI